MTLVESILLFVLGAALAAIIVYLVAVRKRNARIAQLNQEKSQLQMEAGILESKLAAQDEQMKARDEQMKAQEERFKQQSAEQMETLRLTFEKSATELFEKRTKDLNEQNAAGMKTIIDPLKEEMSHFKEAVEGAKKQSTEDSAALKENIKALMERSLTLGNEANNLAQALRGNNKISGNWGESHLINILEEAGLREGVDFDTQVLIRGEKGEAVRNEETDKKLIADVIVHFPDEKCVIIDSKVSLEGYLDYTAAQTDEDRNAADKKHLESVRRHIDELSDKDYAKYLKKKNQDTLQYMIMYIPMEGAFQLFFQNHQDEWRKAYDKQIIITSDLYVITMLKVIQMAWGEYRRNKNYDKILESSRMMLDRVDGFAKDFDAIGDGIEKMQKSFRDAQKRWHDGPRSIDAIHAKINELGVESKNILQ